MKRDLISLSDINAKEFRHILDLASNLKKNKSQNTDFLNGKTIGLIFQKPSNRTRVSFEVGIWQLGGNCIYLGPKEIALGERESTADVAKTLSRYLDGIVARTNRHKDVVDLGKYATVPIINGLSDLYHPCQALADLMSVHEKLGSLQGLKMAYIGDGNNVCHSLILACAKAGMHIRIATPKGYEPDDDIINLAEEDAKASGTQITVTSSPQEAAQGAHVLYSDVWVSMGQEDESGDRLNLFKDYQVNGSLAGLADKDYIYMHCLPAHRGQEVTEDIIDGKHSIVFDQAENRMHVQKAVLIFLMKSS